MSILLKRHRIELEVNDHCRSYEKSSTWVRLGAQTSGAPPERRSSPIYWASSDEKGFESPQVVSPITDVTAFLAGLRFEKRKLLDELPLDLDTR
jgi:hypothetical protein